MNKDAKVFWLFGRSGAGKTTLARIVCNTLSNGGLRFIYLDGDEIRASLSSDLGYKPECRLENHRRIAEVSHILITQQTNVLVSTMAPEYSQRDLVSSILGNSLVWLYVHAPIEVCIARDPKGLYKKAKDGNVKFLLEYPFDLPRPQEQCNYINTVSNSIDECCQRILQVVSTNISFECESR